MSHSKLQTAPATLSPLLSAPQRAGPHHLAAIVLACHETCHTSTAHTTWCCCRKHSPHHWAWLDSTSGTWTKYNEWHTAPPRTRAPATRTPARSTALPETGTSGRLARSLAVLAPRGARAVPHSVQDVLRRPEPQPVGQLPLGLLGRLGRLQQGLWLWHPLPLAPLQWRAQTFLFMYV